MRNSVARFCLIFICFRFLLQLSLVSAVLKFNHKIRKDHCTTKTTCKIWDTPTTLSRSYLTPLLVRYKIHPLLFWKTSERSETISVSPTGRRRSSSLSHHLKRDVIQYRPKSRFKYSTTMHKNNFKERMQFFLGFN